VHIPQRTVEGCIQVTSLYWPLSMDGMRIVPADRIPRGRLVLILNVKVGIVDLGKLASLKDTSEVLLRVANMGSTQAPRLSH
jgi:hypothetical protein